MSTIEKQYSFLITAITYFLSGIGGNIFAVNFNNLSIISVGASTSIYGMLAATIAFFVLNWKALSRVQRTYFFYSLIFIIFISFSMFYTSSELDYMAHFGGFIIGFLLGLCIP